MPASSSGFTLVEVLVAFAILALGLGVVLNVLGIGFRSQRDADQRSHAIHLAQSRLELVGTSEPMIIGRQRGQFSNGFYWDQVVSLLPAQASATNPLVPFVVRLAVSSTTGFPGRSQTITLTTVKLGAPP